MNPARQRLFLLCVALLGASIALGIWALVRIAAGPARRLPDGSTLILETASYGQVHPFVHGEWWQKRLHPLVPPTVRDRSGLWSARSGWLTGAYQSRAPNTLVLQATRRDLPRGGGWRLHAVPVAADGREFARGLGLRSASIPTGAGTMEFCELPAFPRRERSVRVRVYAQAPRGPWVRAGEFRVANPTPGPHPTWAAERLPITRRQGDLALTLARLTTGITPADPRHPHPPGDETWTRAAFRLTRDGRPVEGWRPVWVTLSDATGNRWAHRNRSRHGPAGEAEFVGALPPGETARLRVEVVRTRGFAPEELWTVRGLPLPRRDQLLPDAATARRQGARLSLTLAGRGDPYRRGQVFRQHSATAVVSVQPPAAGLRVTLLRAADERGRMIATFGPTPAPSPGGEFRIYLSSIPAGAATVDLTFAVQKARVFEFLTTSG